MLVDLPAHAGVQQLVRDLNRFYRSEPALHVQDFRPEGFEWVDCHDPDRTILSFLRWSPGWEDFVLVVANFTPVERDDFRLPAPFPGRYRVIFNSDAPVYGGSRKVVPQELDTRPGELLGRDQFLELPLPGLSVLILKHDRS